MLLLEFTLWRTRRPNFAKRRKGLALVIGQFLITSKRKVGGSQEGPLIGSFNRPDAVLQDGLDDLFGVREIRSITNDHIGRHVEGRDKFLQHLARIVFRRAH